MLTDHIALVIQHLVHDVGRIQVAAVDAGRLCPDQFKGRHVKRLSEGIGRQGSRVIHQARFADDSLRLTDHIHAGGFRKAKCLHVLVQSFSTKPLADVDKSRVAGVPHRLFQRLETVPPFFGAVDGPFSHLHGAGAVEGGIHVDHTLLQSGGQGDGLEGGAGLVGGVDALVPPLGLHGAGLGRADRRLVLLLGGVGHALGLQRRQRGLQLGFQGVVVQCSVVIQVIVGIRGHTYDGPGVHVHHDAGGAVFGVELLDHGLHALFQGSLDIDVHGQHQVIAVFRVEDLLIALVQQLRTGGVFGCHRHTGGALQLGVVLGLQPHAALIIGIHKADDIGAQAAVWVDALGIRVHPNALELFPLLFRDFIALLVDLAVDEPPDFVGLGLLHLFPNVLIHGIGLGHALFDPGLVHLQDAAEAPRDVRLVPEFRRGIGLPLFRRLCLGVLDALLLFFHKGGDLLGGDVDLLRRGGDCQHIAVAVIDGTPGRGDRGAAGLLVHSSFPHLVMPVNLEVIQLPEQRQEGAYAQYNHQQCCPGPHHTVGPAGGVTFSAGVWCHARSSSGKA